MATKRQIVEGAFAELALAGYDFDLTPEELTTGLQRLDFMCARWAGEGITLGYAMADPLVGSDLDDDSGLADAVLEAVTANLALRLAALFGKTPAEFTKTTAKTGYDALCAKAAMPRESELPATLPRGAGNKPWRGGNPFFPQPDTAPLGTGDGGDLTFRG